MWDLSNILKLTHNSCNTQTTLMETLPLCLVMKTAAVTLMWGRWAWCSGGFRIKSSYWTARQKRWGWMWPQSEDVCDSDSLLPVRRCCWNQVLRSLIRRSCRLWLRLISGGVLWENQSRGCWWTGLLVNRLLVNKLLVTQLRLWRRFYSNWPGGGACGSSRTQKVQWWTEQNRHRIHRTHIEQT